jgi:hypothetical protein
MKVSAPEYPQFLASLKATIRQRQYQALRAVNHELLALYLEIGEAIYRKQEELGWGKSVVETLAHDLQAEFPGRNGFSARNLWNMKDLYFSYRDFLKLQPLLAEISWAKNLVILARCKDPLLAKLDSQKSANTCRENARSSNDIKKNDFAIHDFDKTKRRVSRPRVQLSAFSLPVSGLPPSLPLMSPSGLPAAVLARIPSREMSRPAGCLFSLPRSRPAAWFPASARWHMFSLQASLYQLYLPDTSCKI